jgi:23S rRNA (guanosine2251-2'-O)-methyltransferase
MRSSRHPSGPRPSTPRSSNPRAPQGEGGKPRHDGKHVGGKPAGKERDTKPQAKPDSGRRLELPRAPQTSGRAEQQRAESHRAGAAAGGHWLYGLHAVTAAMLNPARRLRRLLLTEEGAAALAQHVPTPWAIGPETVERSRLDHMLGRDAVHQGIALQADPLPSPTLQQVVERSGPVLILDQVTDPRNVGAILRSAAAFGAAAVVMQERNAPEETGALAKAASGALEVVPVLRAVNLVRTIVALKAAGFWCVGLDARAKPLIGSEFRQRRVALVLGAEGEGMRRLTRENCDELAALAMSGSMESLNVSAAGTVALYELSRGK